MGLLSRKGALQCALTVLILLLSSAHAQWQPKCPEILRLEPNKFIEMYRERNTYRGDSRPVFEIAGIYANCKKAENNQKMSRSPKLKLRIDTLRELEEAFFDSQALFFLYNGGMSGITGGAGTGLQDLQDRQAIHIEMHLGRVIALVLSKNGAQVNGIIRARYAQAKNILEARMQKMLLGADKNIDPNYLADVKSSNPNYAQDWAKAAKQYQTAYSSILKLVGSPVDSTSTSILEFLAALYYS